MNTPTVFALSAENLTLRYGQTSVLNEISLHVHKGEIVGLIGPNGAGKSTLLKSLAGLIETDSGTISYNNILLNALSLVQRARQIAYLEQQPAVHWPLTVQEVVALGRLPWRNSSSTSQSASAIDSALQEVGIGHLVRRDYPELSEGEKLLVNLARVLATQAPILLIDEPTSALDPYYQTVIMDLLTKLARAGTTIVMVLHDLNAAARYCPQLNLLKQGRIIASGSASDVMQSQHLAAAFQINAHFDPVSRTLSQPERL